MSDRPTNTPLTDEEIESTRRYVAGIAQTDAANVMWDLLATLDASRAQWREFVDARVGLCGLCANTGIITTRQVSFAGVVASYGGPCICPNGRKRKGP